MHTYPLQNLRTPPGGRPCRKRFLVPARPRCVERESGTLALGGLSNLRGLSKGLGFGVSKLVFEVAET